jgi:hypothetical protein
MKSTTCLTLKWRLLARVARPCLSSASHFFGFRISPSWSEIFNRRRISFLNSVTVKFLGRLGKIEGFFISNPWKGTAYILSSLGFFCLFFYWNTLLNLKEVATLNLGVVGTLDLGLAKKWKSPFRFQSDRLTVWN